MKVIYTNDPQGKGTYHPKLGYLKLDDPFDLPDDTAKIYVESGLLSEAKEEEKKEEKKKEKEIEDNHGNLYSAVFEKKGTRAIEA